MLVARLVDSFHIHSGSGLPIGTLTSQYFTNFYLDGHDHRVLEALGCIDYVRYMDENDTSSWPAYERGLMLKGVRRIADGREGLTFLGYRITPHGFLMSRTSRRRISVRVASYERGWANGTMTEAELQRRVDALLAFTYVDQCKRWRHKLFDARMAAFARQGLTL